MPVKLYPGRGESDPIPIRSGSDGSPGLKAGVFFGNKNFHPALCDIEYFS